MRVLSGIFNMITALWSEARRLILVLWLCRISTLSAILALILAFLPQLQDLYTEISYYQQPALTDYMDTGLYWLAFYALCFLWAFTVHYCARTVLSFETWPLRQSDAPAYAYWIEAVPRYLGWICIISIFVGQINALQNLQIDDEHITRTTSSHYATPLAVLLLLIIAMQTARRKLGKSTVMISALGVIYWLITAYDIYDRQNITEAYRAQVLHNIALPVVTIIWGVLFYCFVAERRRLLDFAARLMPLAHRIMLHATRQLAEFFPVQIRPMHNQAVRRRAPKFLPFKKRGLFRFEAPSENVRGLMLGLFCLTIVMMLWLAFAITDPGAPPLGLGRALLLPVLLGLWVPLLTTITFISNQIRFPLLTSLIILGLSMSWLIGDNHDIKTAAPWRQNIAEAELSPPPEKLDVKKALEFWMSHHNCLETPRACPPPLIIAASGGASRSAFFVATVLGELHDKPSLFWPKDIPKHKRPRSAKMVKEQIFAISSVSGGSLASALYAALLRGESASLYPGKPCNAAQLRSDRLLFSIPEDKKQRLNYPINWKNCLQAVTAGDFLSPTMISYTFRDNLAISSLIGLISGEDRATALEKAWINREQQLTERHHMNDPLLSFQPTKSLWMPLMLFNATSVTTGKRLIATPLAATYNPDEKISFAPYPGGDMPETRIIPDSGEQKNTQHPPLFPDSLDLHALLNQPRTKTENWKEQDQSQTRLSDISLAQAVSLSARFPLISPHANILAADGRLIDRIVDGGYFDNSGMLTALELMRAIKMLTNNAIKPILIQVSNHPVTINAVPRISLKEREDKSTANDKMRVTSKTGLQCPAHSFINHASPLSPRQPLSEIFSVTSALLNARVARGSHAIAQAYQEAGERFVHFQVAGIRDELGASKKLSMSWWLSKSVQNALNNQISWARKQKTGTPQPLHERLNPAFCAIKKFRRAQKAHWRDIKPTYRTLGLNP